MIRRLLMGVSLGLLCCLLPISAALAQQVDDSTRIAYGQTLIGSLDNEDYRSLFIFSGRQGEIITIHMRTLEGDLDPFLSLVDESGTGIAFSDDDGDHQNALLDAVRLPHDGEYFIIATRFGHQQGSTSGSYELSLGRIGAAATPSGATIRYGDRIIGEITPEHPQIIYAFAGQRGEVVNIRMTRTSGNLDPFLDLATAQGVILRSGDDDPSVTGTLDAAILNFTLPETSYYLIAATRYGRDSGETSGSFLLSLEAIPEEQRGLAPSNAILLDYGKTVQGSISSEVPQKFYTFEGRRGDVITLSLARTFGNLSVLMILLDSDLSELARVGDTAPQDRVNIPAYTLPTDGNYYIMATRYEFSEGITEGNFDLTLTGRAGIGDGTYLEITYDSQTTGFLNDILPYESFVFTGKADDVITVRMEATSDTLDPLLTLFHDGKQLVFDDDSGEGNNAKIRNFRLPADGIYRIEAARVNREQGQTEGGYVLILEGR